MKTILVTGAAGYIGSHACLELLGAGHGVIGVDNFDNSSPASIERVQKLAGRELDGMYGIDLRDRAALKHVFSNHQIDSVVHFAGLKAVGESVEKPLLYYDTNVGSTLSLIDAMQHHGVREMVFSSSCTVYGSPNQKAVPLVEESTLQAVNPYGRTKLLIEEMLRDLCTADEEWRVTALRYFNPIGAHSSGHIGEDPTGIPNNLLPFIMQVAVGRRPSLNVFGDDYPTHDGTCIRDYIHVVDLVRGHLMALNRSGGAGFEAINLGTGVGSSVFDVIAACERAVGAPIPYTIEPRRDGDAISVYAEPSHAFLTLAWKAEFDLERMCEDHWRWQSMNPAGYSDGQFG